MNYELRIKLNYILEYLLYLFVFLIPWQTRWIIWDPGINDKVWEYGRIAIYGLDIVFIVLCMMYYVLSIKNKNHKLQITNYKSHFIFIALLLYYSITFIFVDDKLLSFYWLLRILQGIILVWLISKINFSKIKLAMSFVISMTLSAGLGIYQFLTQSAFASKWLGLASHSASVLGDSVVELANERWLRAYGSFPHPNIFAGFLIIAIIFCFYLFNVLSKNDQEIEKLEIKKLRTLKILLITNYLLLITNLFLTFSRAGWFAFLLITAYCLLVAFLKKDKNKLFISGVLLIVFCVLSIIYWPLVKIRIISAERLEIASNVERINNLEQSFKIIKNNLWLGTGTGNYTVELQKVYPDKPAYFYQPVHNVYLLVLAELGVVGIIFIFLFLYFYFKNKKLLITSCCLLITAFLFFFDHFWWTLPSGMMLVFLVFRLFFINKHSFLAEGD